VSVSAIGTGLTDTHIRIDQKPEPRVQTWSSLRASLHVSTVGWTWWDWSL